MATITIQYVSQYGTPPNTSSCESGVPIILTEDILPTLVDPNGNATFVGWYTDDTFSDVFLLSVGDTYTPTASITLYARWEVVVTIYESTLVDIANAIREKNNSTDTYKPKEMADAISEINYTSLDDGIEVIATEDIAAGDIVYLVENQYLKLDISAYLKADVLLND